MQRIGLLVLLLCLAMGAQAATPDQASTEAKIKKLQHNIATLQKSIDSRKGKQHDVEVALRKSEREISRIHKALRRIDRELAQFGDDLTHINARADELEKKIRANRKRIVNLLREAYKQGQQPRLQTLLEQRDPERGERMLHYYDRINEELVAQLSEFQKQKDELEATHEQAHDKKADIRARRADLKKQEAALTHARATRKSTLTKLANAQKRDLKRLSSLKADQQQLREVLKGIQRSLEVAELAPVDQAFAKVKGKLPWPVSSRRVLRSYGSKSDGVAYGGMLLAAKAGAPVKAVHAGRVVFSDWLRGYGLLMIIDHGNGYMSLYGHNESLLKDTGTWIRAGQTIATAGDSGGFDTTGLYFAIRHKGNSVDPIVWLKRR